MDDLIPEATLLGMSYYAPVASLSVMEQLHNTDQLGPYNLVLAHDVLDKHNEYRRFFQELHGHFRGKIFTILDNSIVELGASLPARDLGIAAAHVSANCIVLPDVMEDSQGTYKASMLGADALAREGVGCAFMAVPQGNSIPDFHWCAMQQAQIKGVQYWGIPRLLTNKHGSRELLKGIMGYEGTRSTGPFIHMLGMSSNIMDDIWCATYPAVMGIDSANPIVMGLNGNNLSEGYEHSKRPDNYLDMHKVNNQAIENCQHVRTLLHNMHITRASSNIARPSVFAPGNA